jgi:hypothetical protein
MRIGSQIIHGDNEQDFKARLNDALNLLHEEADRNTEQINAMEGSIHSIIIQQDNDFDN